VIGVIRVTLAAKTETAFGFKCNKKGVIFLIATEPTKLTHPVRYISKWASRGFDRA